MDEKTAVEILVRNGASVFDNKTIDEYLVEFCDFDPAEVNLYEEAKRYLLSECGYTQLK